MSTSAITIDPSDVQVDLSAGLQPKGGIDPSDVQIDTSPDAQPVQAGEQLNDVGNKVIVPKDGESFQDTIKRGIALSKARDAAGTQQAVISKETATAPKKAAQTLGAAATIGVVGPALLAAPGELGEFAIKHLAGNVLPGMESEAAKQVLLRAIPKVVEFAQGMGKLGLGAAGIHYLIKSVTGGK